MPGRRWRRNSVASCLPASAEVISCKNTAHRTASPVMALAIDLSSSADRSSSPCAAATSAAVLSCFPPPAPPFAFSLTLLPFLPAGLTAVGRGFGPAACPTPLLASARAVSSASSAACCARRRAAAALFRRSFSRSASSFAGPICRYFVRHVSHSSTAVRRPLVSASAARCALPGAFCSGSGLVRKPAAATLARSWV